MAKRERPMEERVAEAVASMRRSAAPATPTGAAVDQTELWWLRRGVVEMAVDLLRVRRGPAVADRIERLLGAVRDAETTAAVVPARAALDAAVLDLAQVVHVGPWNDQPRSRCPVCGAGPDTSNPASPSGAVNGYVVPLGLGRHLRGWGAQAQCVVMNAVDAEQRDRVRVLRDGSGQ